MRRVHTATRACLGHAWPAHDEGLARASFVEAAFAVPQRRIVRDAAALNALAFIAAHSAVVGGEDEHRAVGELEFIERLHHASDALIHARDHRGIHRAVVAADRGLVFELGDEVSLRLMRRVNAEVRQVKEERAVLVSLDEIDRLVGEKVGEIRALVVWRLRVGREVEVLPHAHDGFVEAALARMIVAFLAEVPLAEHRRRIACRLQCLGQNGAIERQLRHIVRGA